MQRSGGKETDYKGALGNFVAGRNVYIFIGVQQQQLGFPDGASGEESACQCRRHKRGRFSPWVGKIPWRKAWQPTPVFLLRISHGQRRLASYSPWGHKESDTIERLN